MGFGFASENNDLTKKRAHEDLISALREIVPESQISFSHKPEYCCVALVDIVNSTNITSKLSNIYACFYYDVFLNTMSTIAMDSGAVVVKNIGDSLLLFYPSTIGSKKKTGFESVIDSLFKMINARPLINEILDNNNLPEMSYRISCDYGSVMMADTKTSNTKDVFGSPVNFCTKINRFANPNQVVIGGDMYQCVRKEKNFKFRELKLNYEDKIKYPVYEIARKYQTK